LGGSVVGFQQALAEIFALFLFNTAGARYVIAAFLSICPDLRANFDI